MRANSLRSNRPWQTLDAPCPNLTQGVDMLSKLLWFALGAGFMRYTMNRQNRQRDAAGGERGAHAGGSTRADGEFAGDDQGWQQDRRDGGGASAGAGGGGAMSGGMGSMGSSMGGGLQG